MPRGASCRPLSGVVMEESIPGRRLVLCSAFQRVRCKRQWNDHKEGV